MSAGSTSPEKVSAPPSASSTPGLGDRVRSAIQRRSRLLMALCGVVALLVGLRAGSGARASSIEAALSAVCAEQGVRVDPSTVLWLEEDSGPLTMRGALFLGRRAGELDDLYYAEIRAAGEGTALDVAWLSNLTRTASANEEQLERVGRRFVFASRVGERFEAVTLVDPAGESVELTDGWTSLARGQASITRLQESGRAEGFGIRRYQLEEPALSMELTVDGSRAIATVPAGRIVIDPAEAELAEGEALASAQPQTRGAPETVSWLVDTVRGLSFVGPEPIEWLENRAFAAKDLATRAYYSVFDPPDTATEAAEDLAVRETVSEERIALLTVTDPEMGWPPAPLEPVLDEAAEGEGRWMPVVDDPFVATYPNAPTTFFQTFLRTDRARSFTRVYVTIWDPRQVQMRIQSGVAEPESATGERGTGMVPRDEDLSRLVGAFNGGFQSLHGEFGMIASGRVYLPPKPWAATVAVFDDGRVGMGSWPAPNWEGRRYEEQLANQQIPEDMVDMRQNLTSVVEDGTFNPWRRWYWGAAPRSAAEQTFTTRSGMCLTEEGFLAYFYSRGVGPEALGEAMIHTRCRRALHLDMNHPHCGFEFFRPIAPGEEVEPLEERPRRDFEYEGPFPRTEGGWRLRARRAVRSMRMPFPRYSDQDARDFFYLTLRPVLPGPHIALEGGAEGEGVFSTEGLPHAGWPHAFARAYLGAEEARTWIVRVDPQRAVPEPARHESHRTALAYLSHSAPAARDADLAVVAHRTDVGWRYAVRAAGEGDRVVAAGAAIGSRPTAESALGVDGDGYLVYAERAGDSTPLADRLASAGVELAVALPPNARLVFAVEGGQAGADGFSVDPIDRERALALYAETRPRAEVMFEDTEPVPYSTWGYLQDRRVRYFPDHSGGPRFGRPPGVE